MFKVIKQVDFFTTPLECISMKRDKNFGRNGRWIFLCQSLKILSSRLKKTTFRTQKIAEKLKNELDIEKIANLNVATGILSNEKTLPPKMKFRLLYSPIIAWTIHVSITIKRQN